MIELMQDTPFSEMDMDNTDQIGIVAIGSAGVNVVDQMILDRVAPGRLLCLDSDQQVLVGSVARDSYLAGRDRIRGLGTGGDPVLGASLMGEDCEDLMEHLQGLKVVIVVTGLGGGTGSGMAPKLVREFAKNGVRTVVLGVTPFAFEGERRRRQALDAAAQLKRDADVLFLFSNDRLTRMNGLDYDIREAFKVMNSMVGRAARSLREILTSRGLMQVDLADLRSITGMEEGWVSGLENSWVGFGSGHGEDRIRDAVEEGMGSLLFDGGRIWEDADHILVSLVGGKNMSMAEFQGVMEIIREEVPAGIPILSSACVTDGAEDSLEFTILVTRSEAAGVAEEGAMTTEAVENLLSEQKNLEQKPTFEMKEAYDEEGDLHASFKTLEEKQMEDGSAEEDDGGGVQRYFLEQDELPLDSNRELLGRFAKAAPTIFKGQNLDQPTFMRLNIKVKL